MAQKHAGLPNETVFVECRAFVFYHQAGHNRWLEVGDPNVYSRVQLLGNRQGGSTGLYRIFGRLESSGMPTLNLPLSESMIYQVVQPTWHYIRLIGGIIYGLHFGPDSNGSYFSIIVQNILLSLQGTQSLPVDTRANWTGPSNPQPPLQNTPPAALAPAPAPAQKSSDPSSREVLGALKAREMNDARIDASSGHQHLDEKFQFEKSKWEEERNVLVTELEGLQEELENTKQAKEEAEQRIACLEGELRIKDEHVNELEQTLSTIQQTLDECKQKVSRDWVISRDEILMTDTCLGVGGWGTVLLGKFRGCKVAVKQIHELILSPHNRRLFEREMNIASRCRHPCLLQFIGATNDEGTPLFVTELMESSLRTLLEQQLLPTSDICILSVDIAQALNYLHLSKPPIIHRDISSANVLLWRQGEQWRGKVSDYGTANFMQQIMTVAPGAMIYSAPEALTSNQTIKTDVYSFGVLLCEMCIRELPDPQNREEQVAMVTNYLFRSLMRRCLQAEPKERPHMEEVIENLESYTL